MFSSDSIPRYVTPVILSFFLCLFFILLLAPASSIVKEEDPRMLLANLGTPRRRRISRSLIICKSRSLSINTELRSYGRERERKIHDTSLLFFTLFFLFFIIFLTPPSLYLSFFHHLLRVQASTRGKP